MNFADWTKLFLLFTGPVLRT